MLNGYGYGASVGGGIAGPAVEPFNGNLVTGATRPPSGIGSPSGVDAGDRFRTQRPSTHRLAGWD
jgi:hypothetical protein